ncbi:Vacuolar protein sorting-associated protein ist1 [Dimargaris xerosporica]|nr:Vacuolar protein sorting-associated protein ist1 [Dimargaris xerosporica]
MPFSSVRLKVQLKLALGRFQLLKAKKTATSAHLRKEIGQLLAAHKEENARIRVERVIREDLTIEAMEILELYCELLLARIGLLDQMKQCDPSLLEPIHSLIYATPRIDVQELTMIRDLLGSKFGKDFLVKGSENSNNMVNPRLLLKLSWDAPDPFLVNEYLKEIAKSNEIDWLPADELVTTDDTDAQATVQALEKELDIVTNKLSVNSSSAQRELPNTTFAKAAAASPSPETKPSSAKSPPTKATADADFDALARRFEALKSRK